VYPSIFVSNSEQRVGFEMLALHQMVYECGDVLLQLAVQKGGAPCDSECKSSALL
jgi:hypothetical protein